MNLRYASILLALPLLLSACGGNQPRPAAQTVTPTPTLGAPEVIVTHAPDPLTAAQTFVDAWKADEYSQMFALLTKASQATITEETFTKFYQDTAASLTLSGLDVVLRDATKNPANASLPLSVTYHTALFGDLQRDLKMDLVRDQPGGDWRITWDYGLVMPELAGGNKLVLEIAPQQRGEILDRDGDPLVRQADGYALGVDPGQIEPEQEGTFNTLLSRLTGLLPKWVHALYDEVAPGYIPVGETLAEDYQDNYSSISSLEGRGLYANPFSGRYYTDGGIAPHVTGYSLSVPAERVEEYRRLGYLPNERVGQDGLEAWGEDYLRGKPGAALTVQDPQGQPLTRLTEVSSQPPQNITTTIDTQLQREAQRSLANFTGAIVVMERDTGRILAMASSPTYNPNAFNADYFDQSGRMLGNAFNANTTPLVNRAAQGSGYPLGSVFKIITMAAALQSGLYTAEQPRLDCPYAWEELPGLTLYDWTYEKEVPASNTYFPDGMLNLPQALMRSCNPWFYHIGLDLYRQKGAHELSNMARGFGLGSPTGIEEIEETAGAMPDPVSEMDAVQLAIGQGQMLVTPLQVARFVAAVGNGGTLYRPQLVDSIAPPDGQPSYTFEPEAQGKLPISPENLQIIQNAMRSVVADSKGTAYPTFTSINLPVNGKTGTASTDLGIPDAWFAGYTDTGNPDKPDIAVAVLGVYAGEGSEIAAPIFRRMLEVYYYGRPMRLFRWESEYYVTRTPTPSVTDTPVPPAEPAVTDTPTP